jgi:hypothetical protein
VWPDLGGMLLWTPVDHCGGVVAETENPTGRNGMADSLEKNFERMGCGKLVLDTQRAREHSVTIATEGSVSDEVVGRYLEAWKRMGFLN